MFSAVGQLVFTGMQANLFEFNFFLRITFHKMGKLDGQDCPQSKTIGVVPGP